MNAFYTWRKSWASHKFSMTHDSCHVNIILIFLSIWERKALKKYRCVLSKLICFFKQPQKLFPPEAVAVTFCFQSTKELLSIRTHQCRSRARNSISISPWELDPRPVYGVREGLGDILLSIHIRVALNMHLSAYLSKQGSRCTLGRNRILIFHENWI